MLVLTRYPKQSIKIYLPDGQELQLTLLSISEDGKSGRIGINAPSNIKIFREEIISKKSLQNVVCQPNQL